MEQKYLEVEDCLSERGQQSSSPFPDIKTIVIWKQI